MSRLIKKVVVPRAKVNNTALDRTSPFVAHASIQFTSKMVTSDTLLWAIFCCFGGGGGVPAQLRNWE